MRILHVINVRWFNATAWYALTLAKLQKKHGHDVDIITIQGTDTDIKAKALGFTPLYIDCTTANPLRIFRSLCSLIKYIRSVRPDIINCHRGEFFIVFALLRLLYPYVLIRTRGDQRLPKTNWINILLHKYCVDAIISTNTRMTHALERSFHLPQGSVYTIFGGVDTSFFTFSQEGRKRIRAKYGCTEEDYVLGVLGRLDWVKGQKELIEAIANIKASMSYPITLLILGFSAGIEEAVVQQWIADVHMEDVIYITGKCDVIVDYISALDIAILSSLGSETIARAALEIMSCGIPLLSTNVGVMPDLIPEQYLISLPTSHTDVVGVLQRAIIECLSHPERTELLRTLQSERMTTLTEEHFYELTQAVYMNAMQDRVERRNR